MKCKMFSVAIFSVILICSLNSQAARVKRQGSSFMILSNTTLPCEELQLQEGPGTRRVELTDEQKMQLFQAAGGNYNKKYQAITRDEARANFPMLVDLNDKYTEKILETSKSPQREHQSTLTKDHITNYMLNHVYSTITPARDNEKLQTPQEAITDARSLQLREFLDTVTDVEDVGRRAYLWQRWTSERGREDFPLVLPEILHLQRQRLKADGSMTEIQGCFPRGSETVDPTYLRMCTVCTTTTAFGENKWPPFINEAICDAADMDCLPVDTVSHGICQQISTTVDILVKTINQCTLALQGGDTVIAESWVMSKYQVAVGCECAINKNSYLAEYL